MNASHNYYRCESPTAKEFAEQWGLTESQVRRAFHPSEWHHCNLTYGDAARAYFYGYSREDLAQILWQARAGKFEDLDFHHSHISGGKAGQEAYLLKIWKKRGQFRPRRRAENHNAHVKTREAMIERKREARRDNKRCLDPLQPNPSAYWSIELSKAMSSLYDKLLSKAKKRNAKRQRADDIATRPFIIQSSNSGRSLYICNRRTGCRVVSPFKTKSELTAHVDALNAAQKGE